MWEIFEQWLLSSALLWALWVLYSKLIKKQSGCEKPCGKKIFSNESELLKLRLRTKSQK